MILPVILIHRVNLDSKCSFGWNSSNRFSQSVEFSTINVQINLCSDCHLYIIRSQDVNIYISQQESENERYKANSKSMSLKSSKIDNNSVSTNIWTENLSSSVLNTKTLKSGILKENPLYTHVTIFNYINSYNLYIKTNSVLSMLSLSQQCLYGI